jgi:hypothetical protein
MNGRSFFSIFGLAAALFVAHTTPVAAQSMETVTLAGESDLPLLMDSDAEYEKDVASLTALTEGGKRRAKPNLRTMLRRVEREWPRLLLRYAQPAVRGLLADRQRGSNSVLLNTTLFRDNSKGLHLAGGVGRNSWGRTGSAAQF